MLLTESPWSAAELRRQRLELILLVLQGRPIVLIIDETGDKKKSDHYLPSIGKVSTSPEKITQHHDFEKFLPFQSQQN